MEQYMTPQEMKEIEEILESKKDQLLRAARQSISEQVNAGDPLPADSIDISTDESLQVTELRLRDREKYLLAKIEKALVRMKTDPEFGYCSECGAEIGFPRLKARPMAELCIDCKEEQERAEKRLPDKRQEEERNSRSFFP
ncbi:MAG: TraR/DksA C4-type zinc finger protein [Myxococcales bacterium]|nr:TraR/DksA C4-type zinc finger protein [Myxococcales bacterium]